MRRDDTIIEYNSGGFSYAGPLGSALTDSDLKLLQERLAVLLEETREDAVRLERERLSILLFGSKGIHLR